ncbi:polyphosphate polymerase domain-containing protein [Lysinibacter cavernae]|uniref:VTC domain-containing protein n=1 Tax=Lysinibacter cavernae TaxID=1640652 RepID=A0A7X5TTL5_9MICO|nr:polyphosphate polymerase domain-containing protein [Lysinibacter cavernae]NIH54756.1 hypothetical protein [Lysinibacter cavernae]
MTNGLECGFGSLEPISLDELVSEAALLTRIDRKYVVPLAALDSLAAGLSEKARVLEIAGSRGFGYESVYFDTPALSSYWLAAHGRRRRFKIRTRAYLETDSAYLEVKTKGGRSSTVKERLEYRASEAGQLTLEGQCYVSEVLADAGIPDIDPGELRPILTTRYDRTTLFLPSGQSRSTIDTGLTWQLNDGPGFNLPDLAIVETKSGSRPSEVDRMLWRHGHRPATISKYATGLAALRPELAANKWGRVLNSSFGRQGRPALGGTVPGTSTLGSAVPSGSALGRPVPGHRVPSRGIHLSHPSSATR